MSSFWNNRISISIFGESHGPAIGVTIDNLPPGEYIDMDKITPCPEEGWNHHATQ